MILMKIKQFFCKHNYEVVGLEEIHGTCTVFVERCKKCGKIRGY